MQTLFFLQNREFGINICGSDLTAGLQSGTQLCGSLSLYCLQLKERQI